MKEGTQDDRNAIGEGCFQEKGLPDEGLETGSPQIAQSGTQAEVEMRSASLLYDREVAVVILFIQFAGIEGM